MKLELIQITYKNFKETHIGNSFLNGKLKIEFSETNKLFTFNK
jgi:hypothetical protein